MRRSWELSCTAEDHPPRLESDPISAIPPAATRLLVPAIRALASLALLSTMALAQEAADPGFGVRPERWPTLWIFLLFSVVVIGSIEFARRGRPLFIRRIAGLNAIDEAIGRSTEMGRKVLFVPGIGSIDEIQTIAALSILKHVAMETGRYATPLEVPNRDPLTYASALETVREGYLEAGRPDLFNEDETVYYVTYDQFAYTASVSGKMMREKPAVNFLIGQFFAESLLLAESGQAAGAVQISGTAEVAQLPFFVCATDYTLIGEELYAASAYLSREPVMLGSIKGQDLFKLGLIVFLIVGVAIASVSGNLTLAEWIRGG